MEWCFLLGDCLLRNRKNGREFFGKEAEKGEFEKKLKASDSSMLKEFSLDGVSNRGASEFLRDTVSKVVWLILTKVA